MSPKITSLTAAGLTALGMTWAATRGVAEPQAPTAPQRPAPSPSVSAVPATAPEGKPTVLLLNNGHVLEGEVFEDDKGYSLRHRLGPMHYARRQVAGAFRSMEETYRFKLARTPLNDPDERMKLAYWCLEHKLPEQ